MRTLIAAAKRDYDSEGFMLLGVFGSQARGDSGSDSDLDLLYRLATKKTSVEQSLLFRRGSYFALFGAKTPGELLYSVTSTGLRFPISFRVSLESYSLFVQPAGSPCPDNERSATRTLVRSSLEHIPLCLAGSQMPECHSDQVRRSVAAPVIAGLSGKHSLSEGTGRSGVDRRVALRREPPASSMLKVTPVVPGS